MEIIIGMMLFAILPAAAASGRGRSGIAWWFISIMISFIIALPLVYILPNLKENSES